MSDEATKHEHDANDPAWCDKCLSDFDKTEKPDCMWSPIPFCVTCGIAHDEKGVVVTASDPSPELRERIEALSREVMSRLARGVRDDFKALAHSVGGPAAYFQGEAEFSLGERHERNRVEARRLRDISNTYMRCAAHVAEMFRVPEDDDGEGAIRLLDDKGEPK